MLSIVHVYMHSSLDWAHYCVVSSWLSTIMEPLMGLMYLTAHEYHHNTIHDLWPTTHNYTMPLLPFAFPILQSASLHHFGPTLLFLLSGASHTTNHHGPDSVVGNGEGQTNLYGRCVLRMYVCVHVYQVGENGLHLQAVGENVLTN